VALIGEVGIDVMVSGLANSVAAVGFPEFVIERVTSPTRIGRRVGSRRSDRFLWR
jgi:hypothetical protein